MKGKVKHTFIFESRILISQNHTNKFTRKCIHVKRERNTGKIYNTSNSEYICVHRLNISQNETDGLGKTDNLSHRQNRLTDFSIFRIAPVELPQNNHDPLFTFRAFRFERGK